MPTDLSAVEERLRRYNRAFTSLAAERSQFEWQWQLLSQHLAPMRRRFSDDGRKPPESWSPTVYNNKPGLDIRRAVAGFVAGMCPASERWFDWGTLDPDLQKYKPVKEWIEAAEDQTLRVFSRSNWYSSVIPIAADVMTYGQAAGWILDDPEDIARVYTQPIGSYYLETDYRRTPTALWVKLRMTAAQMIETFGAENVSPAVRTAADQHKAEPFDVCMVTQRNPAFEPGAADHARRPWIQCYWEQQGASESGEPRFLAEWGYYEQPFFAPRWETTDEWSYGYGPGYDALPDCLALQAMELYKGKGIAKQVEPPTVAHPDVEKKGGVDQTAGGVTYATPLSGSTPGVVPLFKADLRLDQLSAEIQRHEDRIGEATYATLFSVFADTRRNPKTAFEAGELKREALLAIAPNVTRFADEFLNVALDRAFGILLRRGLFPPLPEELRGQTLATRYHSPLVEAQIAAGIGALDQLVGFVAGLSRMYPEARYALDPVVATRKAGEMLRVHPSVLPDDEQIAARQAADAKAQQASQMAEHGPALAQGVKSLADAPVGTNSALDLLLEGATR